MAETNIVVVVAGVVIVATRGTAIPWIVVPGAAAFGCLTHTLEYTTGHAIWLTHHAETPTHRLLR